MSKQGKLLFNVKDLQKAVDSQRKAKGYLIDGELAGKSWAQTMTIFRSSKKDVSALMKDGRYIIFDMVHPDRLHEPWKDRHERLIEVFDSIHPQIRLLKSARVDDFESFDTIHQFNLASGCDGSMLKFRDGGYEFKRSKLWLKVKPQKELDCLIVGFNEGKGKYVGMLGSLIVKVPIEKDEWSEHTTKVSGMDDADRVRMWKHRKQLLGTIVEVQYRAMSKKNKLIEAHVYRPRPDK